ncbi:MAG: c-type cytochrome domain-containing protein [Bryobacteraceae bacterium]
MRFVIQFLLIAQILSARVHFVRDVKPILENHCVRCHGSGSAMRGLRLDRRERAWMAIVKKKPEDSRIYLASKSGSMPPGDQKLTTKELRTLRQWILEGAKWPKGLELEGKNPFLK